MSMSISYTDTGRTRQKARTRAALITATRQLLSQGAMPTVEQAADAAGVSRATAYRYFPNQGDLLVAVHSYVEESSLLPANTGDDVESRLDSVVQQVTTLVAEDETALRAMLRLSLEPDERIREDLPLRQGRRIGWVRDALQPLRHRMPQAEFERTAIAIAAVIGIEALVWLTDIAGLSTEDAVGVMRWTAASLLRSVESDYPRTP